MGTFTSWLAEDLPDPGAELAAIFKARTREREKQVARIQSAWEKRQDYLARPDFIERDVATHAATWSMRPGKVTARRGVSKLEALEERDEATPQKGFASELYDAYVTNLESPETLGYSAKQILAATAKQLMLKPGDDGRPRIEKGWEFKRRADTEIELTHPLRTVGRLLGMKVEDPTVKEPPGYERWLRAKRGREEAELRKEEYLASPEEVGGALLLGAPFGAGGGPVGMGAAGVATAALETVAHPLRRAVAGTEWYRARKSPRYLAGIIPTTWEGLKAGLVRTGPELAAFPGVLRKAARMTAPKMISITTESIRAAHGMPTAENILAKSVAIRKASKSGLHIDQILGDTFEAGWPGAPSGRYDVAKIRDFWKGVLTAPKVKLTPKVKPKTPGQEAFIKLRDSEAVDAALMHPEGIEFGAIEALAAQESRGILVDLKQMAKAYDIAKFPPAKAVTLGERKAINKELASLMKEKATLEAELGGLYKEELISLKDELAGITAKGESFIKKTGHPDTATTSTVGGAAAKEMGPVGEAVLERSTAATDATKTGVLSAEEERILAGYLKKKGAKVGPRVKGEPKVRKVSPEATGLTEEQRVALEVKEAAGWGMEPRDVSIEEVRGLKEFLYGGTKDLEQELFEKGDPDWLKRMLAFALGAFGVGAAAWELVGPAEAEAGVPPGAVKIMTSALAKRLVAPVVKPGQTLVKAADFARGLPFPKGLSRNLRILGPGKGLQYRLMSPGSIFRDLLPSKYGKGAELSGMNPGTYKASYMAPEFFNTMSVGETVSNTLDAAGVKSAYNTVMKETEFLIPLMRQQVAYDVNVAKLGLLTKELMGAAKKVGKGGNVRAHKNDIEILKNALGKTEKNIAELEPAVAEYHRKHGEVMKILADRHPSVRIALALDDAPEYAKYPWLKGKLSYHEEVAAGRLREQLLQYRVRLEERGIPTVKGAYLHHLAHPKFTQEMQAEIAEGAGIRAAAFTKFYSRTFNSRPLVPDVWGTMRSYIYDIERRIQNHDFWRIGEKDGWYAVMNHPAIQENPALKHAFETLWKGTAHLDRTFGNRFAQQYAVVEVLKRLFLNPSAGLKHLIKVTGDAASAGWPETIRALKPSLKHLARRGAKYMPQSARKAMNKMGIASSTEQDKLFDSFYFTIIHPRNLRQIRLEMGIDTPAQVFEAMSGVYGKAQTLGTGFINLAELIDRGVSVAAGTSMAAKRGMTAEQALYGIYDIILKNNFLSRELNPTWAVRPKIRALFMFQLTPYKIMERRAVMAHETGRVIKTLGRDVAKATKTAEGRAKLLADLRGMRKYIKEGEQELKTNLIVDALRSEVDFFGTPVIQQFARELMMIGAGTYVGATAGLSMWHHFVHIPFLSSMHDEPTLALSPGPMAISRGIADWKKREDYDDEFVTTKIFQRWFNKVGPLPDMVRKIQRLSNDDIPEIYRDSHLRYLFAIPGTEQH